MRNFEMKLLSCYNFYASQKPEEVDAMLAAMSGYVMDNTIVVDGDLAEYEGMDIVVTFLKKRENIPNKQLKIDFSKYGHRTERRQHVEEDLSGGQWKE